MMVNRRGKSVPNDIKDVKIPCPSSLICNCLQSVSKLFALLEKLQSEVVERVALSDSKPSWVLRYLSRVQGPVPMFERGL